MLLEQRLLGEGIHFNIFSNDKYVGKAERVIRTIKERVRCIYIILQFNKLPLKMIIELAYFFIFSLNVMHLSVTIVPNMSPRTIMINKTINYDVHCKHEFDQFMQTHDNTM